ncbi:cation:dicarboxylate symporter family transporter [Barnesiella intestinihominis]|uniref:cation:dicarboxylate symporter family transporter n=1 Tax=Barnesiella intestinihominis TaxID=487174 RepID=UPI003AF86BAB
MKKFQISLLWQVLIAIATGIALGQFLPVPVARIFVTFNGLFGNFLTFAIPLIIIGLIIPAISDLGKGAGRLLLIAKVIIPLLPLHIFGIFLNMTVSGQVASIISVFVKIIVVIFILHILLLLVQFVLAGIIGKKNPLRLLRNMLPAYATALGTQSSAATIPVTLAQTIKNGVSKNIATFVIPLCATIHLSGSTMKITACAMAIMIMSGMPVNTADFSGFILMLGITMVAAPGVPGGAIMAALGILEGMLGFDETAQALMIALYIAMDSFGTACNVTGDGAIAVIVDRIDGKKENLMQRS